MSDVVDMAPPPVSAAPKVEPAEFGRLRECPDCGLLQSVPALPIGSTALCLRCDRVLRRRRRDPIGRALAWTIAGLALYAIAIAMPFLALVVRGQHYRTTLLTGPEELTAFGMWQLGIVVLATTVVMPGLKLGAMLTILLGVRSQRPSRWLPRLMRWIEWIKPWAMVEVFLLGVFVAYTRLSALGQVNLGYAFYALFGLMFASIASDASLDHEALWKAMEQRGLCPPPPAPSASALRHGRLVGCDVCEQVNVVVEPAPARMSCTRCGGTLHPRKTDGVRRTWALLIAAAVFYIPANVYPVLTITSLGRDQPSTILGGVEDLAAAGLWPLALLVVFASILVPLLKLIGLGVMLIATQCGAATCLRDRTRLYRLIEVVGRWSMIDVFMISILTATVRVGQLVAVVPGEGALAFCAVVILTMLAAATFDPREMWDSAIARGRDLTEECATA